ncbi:MAG: lipocalin family protein [Sulfurimonadaceae bacterium]|jgi:apolipoprotein D and lipocalin family protein|nr:lipocalin family protein [Sulfurimonadaceae bacterium]
MFKNFLLVFLFLFFAGCSASHPPLATVPHVELDKYSGTWFEIARFEHFFEKGCKNVSASYAIKSDGDVKVTNR